MADPHVEIGRIVGTHGVRGKVKVDPWSGDPAGLLAARRVRVTPPRAGANGQDREYEVKAAHRSGGCAVLHLAGIDSAEEAEGLRGFAVSIRRSQLPAPGKDEYYWIDLIGCEVADPQGRVLGKVTGVTEGPAHDWLAVSRGAGEESMLPLVGAFIRQVDLDRRRITADPPEGW
ncbi:MAG: ribosome maturation factor RimM [Deltaproteobacteria bacterium]